MFLKPYVLHELLTNSNNDNKGKMDQTKKRALNW